MRARDEAFYRRVRLGETRQVNGIWLFYASASFLRIERIEKRIGILNALFHQEARYCRARELSNLRVLGLEGHSGPSSARGAECRGFWRLPVLAAWLCNIIGLPLVKIPWQI